MIMIVKDFKSKAPEVLGTQTGTRGYRTAADRERSIKMLARRGLNYFVCYRDVQSEFALHYGVAFWAGSTPYVVSLGSTKHYGPARCARVRFADRRLEYYCPEELIPMQED